MSTLVHPDQITGLVLAGGRGSRMGGADKGLQSWRGEPLALHALRRLAPQVGALAVSANRHSGDYAALLAATACGAAAEASSRSPLRADPQVLPDTLPNFLGPLAGILAGLTACSTRYLMVVPCDAPLFPADLVERLGYALEAHDAELAMPVTGASGDTRLHPVFCLIDTRAVSTSGSTSEPIGASLARFLADGERRVGFWARQRRSDQVRFDDARAFANINTLDDLRELERHA